MAVNRRTVIKQIFCFSAGITLLPTCFGAVAGRSSILLNNIGVSNDQEKTLDSLADTLIPSSATPGAKTVGANLFILKMMDDCYKKEDQQRFSRGLEQFERIAVEKYGKEFYQCSQLERESILGAIDGKKNLPLELAYFYQVTKKLTIQAYTSSQFYLTNVQVYKMIPGKFQGCVPVKMI